MRNGKRWSWPSRWRPLFVVVLAALFIVIWWLVPPLLYRHTGAGADARLKAITDTRTALFAGLLGVGALLTFWLNSRVYRITAQTLKVSEQGQITERYTKAIEQLGSEKLDVRLGGIYALERIANDSERDLPTVLEVLSAFVREHSDPAHTDSEPSVAKLLSTFLQGDSEPTDERQSDAERPDKRPKPATDVRAALTVLGRLPFSPDAPRADISNASLAGADLRTMNLSLFRFVGADLAGADLTEAVLTSADLVRTDLRVAELMGANLAGADLTGANLAGADLTGANLAGAVLVDADLTDADLTGANLAKANLVEADLTAVNLTKANLTGAMLGRANLMRANVEDANLEDAHLEEANLLAADLTGANLRGAKLWRAQADSETTWPQGLDWQAAGVVMKAGESTG